MGTKEGGWRWTDRPGSQAAVKRKRLGGGGFTGHVFGPRAYVARPHGGTSAALTSPPSSAASEHSHADHAVVPHHAGGHA